MSVLAQVRESIKGHEMLSARETLVVGVSGGPDSLCLLHVLAEIAPNLGVSLHVGHLDHGIRGQEAKEDARFVADLCASWGIECTLGRRDVPGLAESRGRSIEEAARQERYAFLADLARSLGSRKVAVGHNADDQAETVLMHFLRGSGMAGLRGMLPVAPLDEIRFGENMGAVPGILLLRPLLDVPRDDIESYCRDHGLAPRFDRSNLDTTLYRNRLRHELLPALETYNPNIHQVLGRTAKAISGDHELLQELVRGAWNRVVLETSAEAIVFDLEALRTLKVGLQRALLREGVRRLRASLRNVDWVHIENAIKMVARRRVGSKATLPAGLELSLGYGRATMAATGYKAPLIDAPRINRCLAVAIPGETVLPDSEWRVETQLMQLSDLPPSWAESRDPYQACLDAARVGCALTLRRRRAGDRFVPLGLSGHQTIRAFMINARVPSADRDQVPLLLSGSDIAWVVGWRIDERYAISPQTTQVASIRFSKGSPNP